MIMYWQCNGCKNDGSFLARVDASERTISKRAAESHRTHYLNKGCGWPAIVISSRSHASGKWTMKRNKAGIGDQGNSAPWAKAPTPRGSLSNTLGYFSGGTDGG